MPRLPSRLRTVPWLAAAQAALAVRKNWQGLLTERERNRLKDLLRDSRGWPGNLSARERQELRRLVGKLDLAGVGRDMLPLSGLARRGRRKP
jgi:hypothetical protein